MSAKRSSLRSWWFLRQWAFISSLSNPSHKPVQSDILIPCFGDFCSRLFPASQRCIRFQEVTRDVPYGGSRIAMSPLQRLLFCGFIPVILSRAGVGLINSVSLGFLFFLLYFSLQRFKSSYPFFKVTRLVPNSRAIWSCGLVVGSSSQYLSALDALSG